MSIKEEKTKINYEIGDRVIFKCKEVEYESIIINTLKHSVIVPFTHGDKETLELLKSKIELA